MLMVKEGPFMKTRYDDAFFDTPTERRGTDSSKWSEYPPDVIPLWIADMDFRVAEEITEAVVRRARQGIFGYTRISEGTIEAMIGWHRERYGWEIPREWVVPLPGIVPGLHLFCRMLRRVRPERSDVLINLPVYHHFRTAAAMQNARERIVRLNPFGAPTLPDLGGTDARGLGGWMLCNPQNPLGHRWRTEELRRMLDFAAEHDLLLASDEIHGGIVADAPHRYTPLMTVARDDAERRRLIVLVSPSKTFNIPGLECAFAVIPDPELRGRFMSSYRQMIPGVTAFGWVGAEAAYRCGEPWRLGMLAYLRGNRALTEAFAARHGLPMCPMEATYLAFADCTGLLPALRGETPKAFFLRHGVAVHDGELFGAPGWIRINIATRRALLAEAFGRMDAALASVGR